MYIPHFPEDSVLRRHFEAAADLQRRARLREPPTDSVLRRHYEAALSASAALGRRPKAGDSRTERPGADEPGRGPAGRGFLARLRALFGG